MDERKYYYSGYWQKIIYFEKIEDTLRHDFNFPDFNDDFNRYIANKIIACECQCAFMLENEF